MVHPLEVMRRELKDIVKGSMEVSYIITTNVPHKMTSQYLSSVELSKAEWSAEPEPNHENNNPLNKILLQVHKHELHLIKTGGWTCDVCGRTSNSICE